MSEPLVCRGADGPCDNTEGVELVPRRTQYYWNGEGEDPNAPLLLCPSCADFLREYWNDLWSEYYQSVM